MFIRTGTTWTEEAELTASDGAAGDAFSGGVSSLAGVSLDGDTVVVGSVGDDDAGASTGSAYVFIRSGTTWTEQAKLTGDAVAGDQFGASVSLDGDTALVGAIRDDGAALQAGSTYVFTRSGMTWTQQAELTASDAAVGELFGWSVSLDGDTALVGAQSGLNAGIRTGSAYLFTRSGTTWTEEAKFTASDAAANDRFGFSVSLDGDTALVGAFLHDDNGDRSGSAYIFSLGPSNVAPTDIALDSTDVDENAAVGTTVGTFSTTDADASDTHTYMLVAGAGDADNARFSIGGTGGDELLTAESFDFETQGPFSVRVRTTDNNGLFFEKVVAITINDVNEVPTVANPIADVEANQNDPDQIIDLLNVFGDEDAGDMLTLTVMGNTNGTLVSASIVGSTLTLDYLPDESGMANITVRATDMGGLFVEDTFMVTVLSTQQQLDSLLDDVQDLVDGGSLNNGQGNSLSSKLNGAINKLDQGKITPGVNKLGAFVNQVNAFINGGVLTAAEGQPLIDAANAAIASALPGLRADEAFVGTGSVAAAITADDVRSVLGSAIDVWQDQGVDTHQLDSINVHVANLPGTYLGVASADSIWIDVDAAGYGWSLNGSGGMDLLSAVTHELGHVLGFDHDHQAEVMRSTLDVNQPLDTAFTGLDTRSLTALAWPDSANHGGKLETARSDAASPAGDGVAVISRDGDSLIASRSHVQTVTGERGDTRLLKVIDKRNLEEHRGDNEADALAVVDWAMSELENSGDLTVDFFF